VTFQPRWHSTFFAPYFVIGAVYSGLAALASILVIVRRGMRLQEFLRAEHFNALGKLVLIAGMAWTYFWFAGFIVEWYGNDPVVRELIHEEVAGDLAPFFYLQMSANLIPIVLLIFKRVRTTPALLLAATLLVNVGMFTGRPYCHRQPAAQ
jgi:molybdopterin-containing oxidoreductase family membrane subunit